MIDDSIVNGKYGVVRNSIFYTGKCCAKGLVIEIVTVSNQYTPVIYIPSSVNFPLQK